MVLKLGFPAHGFRALRFFLLLIATHQAHAQITTANVTLSINTTQAQSIPIPDDFAGLSFEMGSVVYDSVNKGWFLSGTNNAMIGLLKTLGVKNIRVGGNSAEGGNIATNADEQSVLDFCHAVGSSLMWDLEIKNSLYDPPGKAAIAQSMQNYVSSQNYGTNILMFQVGNEPDLTDNPTNSSQHMSDVIYEGLFNNYVAAVNQLYAGSKWCGPDCAAGGTWYAQTFCPMEASSWPGQIQFVCMHQYPFGSSLDTNTTAVHISWMLSSGVEAGYQKDNNSWVPYAVAAGQAPRYEECNSFFHNGSFGASDAMASALWGLGWMCYQANVGLAGINFHTGSNNNNPAYNTLTPANVTNAYVVHPLAYAMAAFNLGGHGRSVPVTIGNGSGVNLVAYAVLQTDGSLVVTVINREYGSPSSTNASLSINTSGTSYNDGQVMFLTAPNDDPAVTSGVTLGGSAISGTTGSWAGTYQGMARPAGSTFGLTVPHTEAAVIRLFAAAGPAAPTNLTLVAGNSQATLSFSNSPGATGYVIQRSANTGGPYVIIASMVTSNSYTDTSLTNGLSYYYVVAATNNSGVGPQSVEAGVSLGNLPPLAPTGLTATPGDTVVVLNWNASAGATNYVLQSSTNSDASNPMSFVTTNTSYINTGLNDGTTYYYLVYALGTYGQSLPSAGASATPVSGPQFLWTNTITVSAQSWNVNSNWSNGSAFPNATQSVALISSAIAANQTINLNQAITIGALNIGAFGGAASFNIAAAGGALTFDDTPAPATLLQLASSKGDTLSAPLTFNGSLNIKNAAASALTLAGNISGTNNLVVNGGTVVLSSANTFSGTAAIALGTLQLANSLALQAALLNYTNGSLAFNGITTASLGGLSGASASQSLLLQNTASAGVALTVGGNNVSTVYGGGLGGSGSFTKTGTGSLTLSNAYYTGNTTVDTTVNNAGVLTINGGSFGSASSTITVAGTTSGGNIFVMSGGTATANVFNVAVSGNQTGVGATINGNANATFTSSSFGAGGNTLGNVTINTTGNVALGTTTVGKDNNGGLVIQGGTITATSVDVQGAGSSSSGTADLNLSGGSLTIGNSGSSGAFKVGDATGGTTHGGNLNLSGGVLTYLGTDGLRAATGSAATHFGNINLSGGMATLTGVTLNYANSATVTSILTVTNGATLYLGGVGIVVNRPGTTVAVNLANASVGALADWSSVAPVTLFGGTTFQAADASGAAHNISLGGVLSGAGGLTKTGAGTLTLSGTDTYAGATVISAGKLSVNGSLAAGGAVTVGNGGMLGGTGQLSGPVTIQTGGTFAPGNSVGTLTFTNSLTLAAGCTNIFEISKSPLTNDLAKIFGALTNGGTLIVTNLGAVALANGDTFKLLDAASYHGTFARLILPPLPIGLGWNTNGVNTAGTLSVVTIARPVIGPVLASGGGFILAGTGGVANTSFYLLGSTSLTLPLASWPRLLTNQFDNNGNFSFTNLPNTNWPFGYYRLMEP